MLCCCICAMCIWWKAICCCICCAICICICAIMSLALGICISNGIRGSMGAGSGRLGLRKWKGSSLARSVLTLFS